MAALGYEYDYFEDEAGKKQLEKTDIKMKAEGEMGYEPSLLVLMERHTVMETMKAYRTAIRCRLAGVRVSSATTIHSRLRFANIDCEMRFTNDRAGDTLELVPRIRTSAGRSKPSRPPARLRSIARKSVGCALIAHSWPSLWLR